MVAAAVIGGAVIAGGASVVAGNKAAGAQERASQNATEEQQREFDIAYQTQAPYRAVGGEALNKLAALYGLPQTDAQGNPIGPARAPDYSAFTNSPDYQFARQQGIRGVTQNAALASQNYNNYTNRLASLAGIGQTSATNIGNQAIATGQGISANMLAAGNARASGIQNSASGFNNAVQGGLSNYLYYQRMNQPQTGYYPSGGNMYTAPDGYTVNY
jgi:hypothetical protein